jgi:lipopolysaccharide transport system ATP-binding protein
MADIVIQVESLGKKYLIGHQAEAGRYLALRDVMTQNARSLWRKTKDVMRGKPIVRGDTQEEFWALKDLSFEIGRGDAIGIIGRNGAGKSTLLKVLSRITEPSAGRVTIRGRVASLLEVGTGFHPELTGRENIFLNGAILGMTRNEIKRKFDEIVEFSEVEEFLDTPVKRYSSGMYVRLAFAVAAHLEPEILLIDEVLAVGDAAFQEKCLGKMMNMGETGRTLLFISHNMGAIESLCRAVILLDRGKVKIMSSDVKKVIHEYLESTAWTARSRSTASLVPAISTEYFQLIDFRLQKDGDARPTELFSKSDNILVHICVDVFSQDSSLSIGYALYVDKTHECLWWSFTLDAQLAYLRPGHNTLRTTIPLGILNDGAYRIELLAALHNQKWLLQPGLNIVMTRFVVKGGSLGTALLGATTRPGFLFPVYEWNIENG